MPARSSVPDVGRPQRRPSHVPRSRPRKKRACLSSQRCAALTLLGIAQCKNCAVFLAVSCMQETAALLLKVLAHLSGTKCPYAMFYLRQCAHGA
eukprot:365821-Chlamydomonas_euryale.AAC.7